VNASIGWSGIGVAPRPPDQRTRRGDGDVLRTVECEAAVFACRAVEAHPTAKGEAPDPSCLLPAPGARHLFDRLPSERWAVVTMGTVEETTELFTAAALPVPEVIVPITDGAPSAHQLAAERLGADPLFCIAIEDRAAGVDAASQAGMKVIGVATEVRPDELVAATMVIPSLLSLHVVGIRPVLVLEVDALPDIGTTGSNPGKWV
jgi:beta-phosphoglucomutase-like phosphatase (HAD superfamily)